MIPKSMSKFAIVTEIECDILGRINTLSRSYVAQMIHFDLLS